MNNKPVNPNKSGCLADARKFRAQGDFEAAIDSLNQVLQQGRESVEVQVLLARCYKSQGDLSSAVEAMQRAVSLQRSPELFNELGVLWVMSTDHKQAMSCFNKAIALKPNYAAAHNNLGNVYLNTGDLDLAVEAFQSAIEHRDDYPLAHNNLGLSLRAQGNQLAAMTAFDKAINLQPTYVEALCNRGALAQSLGSLEQAERDYNTALTTQADCPDAIAGLAELFEWRGEYGRGLKLLAHVCASERSIAPIVVKARLLRRLGQLEEGVTLLSPLFQRSDIGPNAVAQAAFTLGDLYDALGNYDLAFQAYQTGNQQRPKTFDSAAHHRWVTTLTQAFAKSTRESGPQPSPPVRLPVFIIGMPRSGTSLVEQILASHPQVQAEGEQASIGQMVADLYQEGVYPSALFTLSDDRLDELRAQYWQNIALTESASLVTDKMPLNFLHLGLVQWLFPQAKVIHCTRNPLDTALSCYFTDFIDPNLRFSSDLEQLSDYYRDYARLMTHWHQTLRLELFDLSYEELVNDARPAITQLLKYLDLPWHDDCLEFHHSKRVTNTASHAQVRKPVYRSSVGRHLNYGKHLGPLAGL